MPAVPRYTGSHAQYLREELAAHGGDYDATRRALETDISRQRTDKEFGLVDFLGKVMELLNFDDPDFPRARVSLLKSALGVTGPQSNLRHYRDATRARPRFGARPKGW
jgi:hypothetical protein